MRLYNLMLTLNRTEEKNKNFQKFSFAKLYSLLYPRYIIIIINSVYYNIYYKLNSRIYNTILFIITYTYYFILLFTLSFFNFFFYNKILQYFVYTRFI